MHESDSDASTESVLAVESAREVALTQALTDRIKKMVTEVDIRDVAERLDMIEAAADQLMRSPRWPLPTAVRVALGLGLDVSFDVQPPCVIVWRFDPGDLET